MPAYIDNDYVANAIKSDVYDALTATTASIKTQLIASASAMVAAALENAGYTTDITSSTAPELVKSATLGALLPQLYAREGIKVPDQFAIHMNIFDRIYQGIMPIPELTPTARDAVGGVKFTDSSTTSTSGRPPVFRGLKDVY